MRRRVGQWISIVLVSTFIFGAWACGPDSGLPRESNTGAHDSQPAVHGEIKYFADREAATAAFESGTATIRAGSNFRAMDLRLTADRVNLEFKATLDGRTVVDWHPLRVETHGGRFHRSRIEFDEPVDALHLRGSSAIDFARFEFFPYPTDFFADDARIGRSIGDGLRRRGQFVAKSGRYKAPPSVVQAGNAQVGNFSYIGVQQHCTGSLLPGTKRFGDFLVNQFKGATHYGGYACRKIRGGSGWSVHSTGRAVDIFIPTDGGQADNTLGDPVANYLIRNATKLKMQFFIWDRSKWNIEYGGPKYYGGSHPHHDHLHIELTPNAAKNASNFPKPGGSGGSPDHDASMDVSLDGGLPRVETGGSKGVRDLFPGDRFKAFITLKNESDVVWKGTRIGYMIEEPYLKAVDYEIQDDHPKHDQKSWSKNDADGHSKNPAKSNLGKSGTLHMNAMSPGESKRVVITLEATEYSYGIVDHPDVRGWLWHVDGIYGEQTSFHGSPSNGNAFGHPVRGYVETDVFDRDQWLFRGDDKRDFESWTARGPHDSFKVDTNKDTLALQVAGSDAGLLSPRWTGVDADRFDEMVLHTRSNAGEHTVAVYFQHEGESFADDRVVRFTAPGDGNFHRLVVPIDEHAKWAGGEIRRVRIDPFDSSKPPAGQSWTFNLAGVYFQDSQSQETSGRKTYATSKYVQLERNAGSGGENGGNNGGNQGATGGSSIGSPPGGDGSNDGRSGSTGSKSGSSNSKNRVTQTQATCAAAGGRPLPVTVLLVAFGLLCVRRLWPARKRSHSRRAERSEAQ